MKKRIGIIKKRVPIGNSKKGEGAICGCPLYESLGIVPTVKKGRNPVEKALKKDRIP